MPFWYPQNGQKDAVSENAIELKNQNEGSIINIKIHTKNQPKFFGKFSSWQHALVSISKIVNYLWHLRMWSFQSNIRVNRHVNIWHQSPLWTFQNSPCNVFLPSENILIYWYWKIYVIFNILASSAFRKYSTCWVFFILCLCLCHCLLLCLCLCLVWKGPFWKDKSCSIVMHCIVGWVGLEISVWDDYKSIALGC